MAKIRADRRTLIRWKVYIDRARMYVGYVQFIMIGFVLLDSYRESRLGQLIFANFWIALPILFILFLGLSLIVGRLDTITGLREEELRNSSASNPMIREIHAGMKSIEEELIALRAELNAGGKESV